MKEPPSTNDPAWTGRERGKATEAFGKAVEGKSVERTSASAQRGSQMVKNTAFGLHEGPTPPGLTRSVVTRQSFNQRWRQESRGFRALQWKLREEFNRKAGTLRNTVVQSEGKTRLLKSDFNRAAHVRRGRSR